MARSLKTLAAKPKLVKITLEQIPFEEEVDGKVTVVVDDFEFWTWDRQPLDVFMALASAVSDKEQQQMVMPIVIKLVLDENGKQIIANEEMLPAAALSSAIVKITELLGK